MQRRIGPKFRIWFRIAFILSVASLAAAALSPAAMASRPPQTDWPMFGQNLNNTASAPYTRVNVDNVKALKVKWAFTTSGDVSARAAVVGNVAYFPDWGGHVYAVNTTNGAPIWTKNILTDYLPGMLDPSGNPLTKVVSRTSPVVDASTNTLYLGTQSGAYMLAINTSDGSLKWASQLDAHPYAIDTGSPIVYDGVLYAGVSSTEEAAAADPGYGCCSFRGSVVALNASTGSINWKSYIVPEGYTGGAVWGSTLVPDPELGVVFATTGNNYFTPTDPAYTACVANGGSQTSCLSPDDHFDSIMAFSMGSTTQTAGSVVWATRLGSSDDWNVACFVAENTNCPVGSGPDFDFGSGANLFTVQTANGPKTILGAGQKSGLYSALDPATGQLLWATQVGPGSALGGIQWGSATDGQRIYVGIGNSYGTPYTLPSGQVITSGSWAALDAATGQIIWQTADPNGAMDLGPMTVANGVVYAPSMGAASASTPNMFALDAATGKVRWSFASGGSVMAGAVVTNDTVYWGSGYSNIPGFVGNNTFYAFSTGGH
jgi:polyvinyl alcohol dehydrogenase (cytochrome)